MQLLSPQFTVSSAKEAVVAEADARAPALSQRGFQSVFSEYALRTDGARTTSAGAGASLADQSEVPGLRGQLLPQRQTDTASAGEAGRALAGIEDSLQELTATLENLLSLEQSAPAGETGPLTQFLVEELGLSDSAAADLIDTLETWVAEPPQVAMTPEALVAQGPEALLAVQAMSDSLATLSVDVDQWYQQVASMVDDGSPESILNNLAGTPQDETSVAAPTSVLSMSSTTDPGGSAPRERSLLESLQQWSQALNDGQGGLSQLIASIADRVKAVLNTAASGSLPSTFDQSRPESALLTQDALFTGDKSTPAADTLFNQLLQAGDARTGLDSEALAFTRMTPLAAAVADEAGQLFLGGQAVPDKADAVNAVIQRSLQQPVLAGEAGRQLGERLALMVRGDIQQATIRLDPPELGMMDVRITVQNDQTQVQIIVQNPQVREALESQSIRLREFLEQQGLSLAKLDIRDESSARQQASGDGGDQSNDSGSDATGGKPGDADSADESTVEVAWGQGLVDHFV